MDGHTKSSTLEATQEFLLYPFEPIPNCRPMLSTVINVYSTSFNKPDPVQTTSPPLCRNGLIRLLYRPSARWDHQIAVCCGQQRHHWGTSSRWAYCFCTICTLEVRSHEGQGQYSLLLLSRSFPRYLLIAVTAQGTPCSSLFLSRQTKRGWGVDGNFLFP